MTEEELNPITRAHVDEILVKPELALRAAVASASGAHNRILAGSANAAIFVQDQARLWLEVHARLREEKMHREYEELSAEKESFSKSQIEKDIQEAYETGVNDGIEQATTRAKGPFSMPRSHTASELGRPAVPERDRLLDDPELGGVRPSPFRPSEGEPSIPFVSQGDIGKGTSSGNEASPVS